MTASHKPQTDKVRSRSQQYGHAVLSKAASGASGASGALAAIAMRISEL